MKKCRQCLVKKTINDFHRDKYAKDGHVNVCKCCRAKYKTKYYAENRDKILKYKKEYDKKNYLRIKQYDKERYSKNREKFLKEYKENPRYWNEANKSSYRKNIYKRLLHAAKNRAIKNNIPFSITEEDLTKITHCPILGEKFCFGTKNVHPHKFSRTIDRIDPELGYIPGNVLVVSSLSNVVKNNGSLNELGEIIKFLKNFKKINVSWKEMCLREQYSENINSYLITSKLLESCRHRAKYRNKIYSISRKNIFVPDKCPLLGIPLAKGKGKIWDNSPTIDRFDNDKGYTPENIMIISHKANRMKNQCSINQLEKIYIGYTQRLWDKNSNGKIEILDLTPKEVRSAEKQRKKNKFVLSQ